MKKEDLYATFQHKGETHLLRDGALEQAKLSHYYIRPYTAPDGKVEDIMHCFEDGEVETILAMPKVGRRISLGEAYCRMREECFDETGDLVSFDPCEPKNLPTWCERHGYFVEPDEGEVIRLDCTLVEYLERAG